MLQQVVLCAAKVIIYYSAPKFTNFPLILKGADAPGAFIRFAGKIFFDKREMHTCVDCRTVWF